MMIGMLAGVLLYRPIFSTFLKDADPKRWQVELSGSNVVSYARKITTDTLSRNDTTIIISRREARWNYDRNEFTEKRIDSNYLTKFSMREPGAPRIYSEDERLDKQPVYSNVKLNESNKWKFVFLIWVMIVLVTMVYGPIAAFLVEMFPTKIRYTSMSLPYHIGNGVFGGLVPFIGLLLTTTYPSDPLVGLNYPIGVAALCFVIGTIYLSNKIDKNVQD